MLCSMPLITGLRESFELWPHRASLKPCQNSIHLAFLNRGQQPENYLHIAASSLIRSDQQPEDRKCILSHRYRALALPQAFVHEVELETAEGSRCCSARLWGGRTRSACMDACRISLSHERTPVA